MGSDSETPDSRMADLLSASAPKDAAARVSAVWSSALADKPSSMATLRLDNHTAVPLPSPRVVPAAGESGAPAEYEIIRRIGEGGMGVVFEARQLSLNRTVALKMIQPMLQSNPRAQARFFAEASITGLLEHPGIVTVFDSGITDRGRAFYAMRLVNGQPWSRSIRKRSLEENLSILRSVAEAVAFAHSQGILHNDIKPANVFIGPHGEAWLGDWGLAGRMKDRPRGCSLDPAAGHGGTPAYVSPEAARGEWSRVGIASDVYLLGAVLHEILAGAPPHNAADGAEALTEAARNTAPDMPPPSRASRLARQAWKLTARALSPDPEQRPATALHFAGELALLLGAAERKRGMGWAVAMALLLSLAGVGTWLAVQLQKVKGKLAEETVLRDTLSHYNFVEENIFSLFEPLSKTEEFTQLANPLYREQVLWAFKASEAGTIAEAPAMEWKGAAITKEDFLKNDELWDEFEIMASELLDDLAIEPEIQDRILGNRGTVYDIYNHIAIYFHDGDELFRRYAVKHMDLYSALNSRAAKWLVLVEQAKRAGALTQERGRIFHELGDMIRQDEPLLREIISALKQRRLAKECTLTENILGQIWVKRLESFLDKYAPAEKE